MKAGQSEVARLRGATSNSLHIAALMFGGRSDQFRERLALAVVTPWASWHGGQNRTLRSLSSTIPWEVEQMKGKILEPCFKTLQALTETAQLNHCGMACSFASLPMDEGELAFNEDQADSMGCLAFNLMAARITRLLPLLRGWPRRSVLVLGPEEAQKTLDTCRQGYANFLELSSMGEPWAMKVVRRSIFSTRPCQQLVLAAGREAWQVTARLQELIKMSTRIVVSQLVEDGFNRGRRPLPHLGQPSVFISACAC